MNNFKKRQREKQIRVKKFEMIDIAANWEILTVCKLFGNPTKKDIKDK